MDPFWKDITYLVVIGSAFLLLIFFNRSPRRQQTGLVADPAPSVAASDPLGAEQMLHSISSRLGIVEGRVGSLAAAQELINGLNMRIAAIEANIPSVQDAMEKYSDSLNRISKRDLERERKEGKDIEKKNQTAGQAAADLIGGTDGGSDPTPAQSVPPNNRYGVVGSGGRGRHRRGT